MTDKFLFIVSSHGQLGTSGNRTGSWLEELAAPYWRFVDAGYEVTIASPRGGVAPIDPASMRDPWITAAGRRFLTDAAAAGAMEKTVPLAEVDLDAMAGAFLVGGSATTWDFPHNPTIKKMAEGFFAEDKMIGAVCHGVIGLVMAVDRNGEPLVKNRQLTGISNAEDIMMGLDKIVPVLPEEMLRKLRAIYTAAGPLAEHVVCDPPFFTGQNPASADLLAIRMLDHLDRARLAEA